MATPNKILVNEFTRILCKEKDWYQLGIRLGVAKNNLDNIENQHGSKGPFRCLAEVHEYLSKMDENTLCWERVCTVLREMGNNGLADEIHTEYICVTSHVDRGSSHPTHFSQHSSSPSYSRHSSTDRNYSRRYDSHHHHSSRHQPYSRSSIPIHQHPLPACNNSLLETQDVLEFMGNHTLDDEIHSTYIRTSVPCGFNDPVEAILDPDSEQKSMRKKMIINLHNKVDGLQQKQKSMI